MHEKESIVQDLDCAWNSFMTNRDKEGAVRYACGKMVCQDKVGGFSRLGG